MGPARCCCVGASRAVERSGRYIRQLLACLLAGATRELRVKDFRKSYCCLDSYICRELPGPSSFRQIYVILRIVKLTCAGEQCGLIAVLAVSAYWFSFSPPSCKLRIYKGRYTILGNQLELHPLLLYTISLEKSSAAITSCTTIEDAPFSTYYSYKKGASRRDGAVEKMERGMRRVPRAACAQKPKAPRHYALASRLFSVLSRAHSRG